MISKPNSNVNETETYLISKEYDTITENSFKESEIELFNSKFFDFDSELSYLTPIDQFLISDILFNNLSDKKKIFYDGGQVTAQEQKDRPVDRTLFDLTSDIPWSGKDLDLIMSSALEKTSQRHLANIRRSAI